MSVVEIHSDAKCKDCKAYYKAENGKYYCMNTQKKARRKDIACDLFIYKYS